MAIQGQYMISPLKEFIKDSRAVGIVLIVCTFISMGVSNSALSEGYTSFWLIELPMPTNAIHLPHSILHIINDAFMALFFFLVGLEIKRELMIGELSSIKQSSLPVFAAIGGMVVPSLIYLLWCSNTPFSKGWGIPMATDIAFSLGILSLLGKKAPISLRILLTALAIIDDLGGILAIAVFYAGTLNMQYLILAIVCVVILVLMNLLKVKRYYFFYLTGIALWYCVYNSGIHATIAGVILALAIPLRKISSLEHAFHGPVNFIILPLFALANTAIVLPQQFGFIFSSEIFYGILFGLVTGKPLGIFIASLAAVKLKIAVLPADIQWKHIIGMGLIAGIGFTMSIFMATLAFDLPNAQLIAKVAIVVASLIAGACGFLFLKFINRSKQALHLIKTK